MKIKLRLRDQILNVLITECQEHEHRGCQCNEIDSRDCWASEANQIISLLKAEGLVRLAKDQSLPSTILVGELISQQDMLIAGFKRVEDWD